MTLVFGRRKEEHRLVKPQLHPHGAASLTRPIRGIERLPSNGVIFLMTSNGVDICISIRAERTSPYFTLVRGWKMC